MEPRKVRRSSRILIKAVRNKDYEAVKNLLQRGSNANEVDYRGNSPLHYAVLPAKSLKLVELLLQHNARVDIMNNYDVTPYDYALLEQLFDIINIFAQYKAEISIDAAGLISKGKDFSEKLKKFVYENINVNSNRNGYTILHYAVESDYLNGMRMIISRGADVNEFTKTGRFTPLHFARSTECIKILLRGGADPNTLDDYSRSPLYWLATKESTFPMERKEQWRMIEELIRNNANCIKVIHRAQVIDYERLPEKRYGVENVLKFMALKEHEHHYLNIDHLRLNHDNVLSSFYRHCLNEVVLLKEEKLLDYLTYYDFVANNIHKLSKYVDNKSVKKAFKNKSKLTYMFPIYSEILWGHFKDATEERKLREAACSSLSYAVPCINAGHIATDKILNFIEIEDMKNIVQAFPVVKLQNNK